MQLLARVQLTTIKMSEMGTKHGCSHGRPVYVTMVGVSAPTHLATQEEYEFHADWQAIVNGVHEKGVLLLVGDFTARVGSSKKHQGERNPTWMV